MAKSPPIKKIPGSADFPGECYPTFKEEITTTLNKLSQEVKEKGTLPNPFCGASITLIPKPDKDITKK
jgi:hypothetical protein